MADKLLSDLSKGSWSGATAYTVGDIVDNDGSSYICVANNTNQEPPNATYWALLAQKGADAAQSISGGVENNIVTIDAVGDSKDSGVPISSIPSKATGAEVDTGTNDTKFVTPKAMEDSTFVKASELSGYATKTGSETLTNKIIDGSNNTISNITEAMQTLADNTTNDVSTSKHGYVPKAPNDTAKFLRGDGQWEAPSSSADGWVASSDAWVYVSASTFKITGVDRTAVYTPGTRLKFTQTTAKYAVVVSSTFSTDTTITIAVNTDYTIANAAITSPYYSYQVSPQGYPTWFNFTPTFTTDGTAFTNTPTVNLAKFCLEGKKATINIKWTQNGTAGGTGAMLITIPLTPSVSFVVGWGSSISLNLAFAVAVANTPRFIVTKHDGTTAITNSHQQGCGTTFDIA